MEGAVGGVIGLRFSPWIYGMVFHGAMGSEMSHVWIMAAISAAGALVSMVGDLTASAIKRNYGIRIMENSFRDTAVSWIVSIASFYGAAHLFPCR